MSRSSVPKSMSWWWKTSKSKIPNTSSCCLHHSQCHKSADRTQDDQEAGFLGQRSLEWPRSSRLPNQYFFAGTSKTRRHPNGRPNAHSRRLPSHTSHSTPQPLQLPPGYASSPYSGNDRVCHPRRQRKVQTSRDGRLPSQTSERQDSRKHARKVGTRRSKKSPAKPVHRFNTYRS